MVKLPALHSAGPAAGRSRSRGAARGREYASLAGTVEIKAPPLKRRATIRTMPLDLRRMIPPLTARTTNGGVVCAWDFKQKKNLVIAFLHAGCAACEDFLRTLATRSADLLEREAVALLIFSETPAPCVVEHLPAQIVVATDMTGRSQKSFLGRDALGPAGQRMTGVFVTDRFGELFAQWVGAGDAGLAGLGEILDWLAQIQVACEECGVSHWSADS